jgi:hypothetical protein
MEDFEASPEVETFSARRQRQTRRNRFFESLKNASGAPGG